MSKSRPFKHPYVVGIIGRRGRPTLAAAFNKAFRRLRLPYVYLSFRLEPRFLKNVIACVKMMDIVGLNVSGEYKKAIKSYLDELDTSAKSRGEVDTVRKVGRKFVGYYVGVTPRRPDTILNSINLWGYPKLTS